MAHHWMIVRAKHPDRAILAGLTSETFSNHIDYLLGDTVYRLEAHDGSGEIAGRTTWASLIKYEFELRKFAYRRVNLGSATVAQSFVDARRNDELRTRFIVTSLALNVRRPEPPRFDTAGSSTEGANKRKRDKGAGKGRGSLKGDGKGKKGQPDKAGRLNKLIKQKKAKLQTDGPNGQKICFGYNKPGGCNRGNQCTFAHVCAWCGASHSVEDCRTYAP